MKTNIIKIGIAIIIAIACSYNAFCHSDGCQNPSSIKSPSQVQLGKEKNAFCHSDGCQNPSSNINQRVNPLVDKKDKPHDSDSGWVQKDGYLENALQVGSISFFRYSNDGQNLFIFGSDYTFRKWDVKMGKVVKEKKFNYEHIYSFD